MANPVLFWAKVSVILFVIACGLGVLGYYAIDTGHALAGIVALVIAAGIGAFLYYATHPHMFGK